MSAPEVTRETFVAVWNAVHQEKHPHRIHEVARRLKITYKAARNRAGNLRREGVELPYFGKGGGYEFRADQANLDEAKPIDPPSDRKPGKEFREEGNDATAEARSFGEIHTLDELLRHCQVDLDVWQVERHVVNKWPVGIKTPSGEIKTQQLIQVKAWLKRAVPLVTQIPPVRAAQVTLGPRRKVQPSRSGVQRAVIIPDPQFGFRRDMRTSYLDPFHDRQALDLALQLVEELRPDRVVWLGDGQDLAPWSDKFLRSPEFVLTTQPAIDEETWWLAETRRAVPGAQIDRIEGNHDARLLNAVMKHLPEAYGLRPGTQRIEGPPVLSIPYLLGLDQLGVEYHGPYPDGVVWLNDNLACEHGDVYTGGAVGTVKRLLETARHSRIIGHTHGVAVVDYEPGNGLYDVHVVQIYGGRCVFEGKTYQARDRVDEIAAATRYETMKPPQPSAA